LKAFEEQEAIAIVEEGKIVAVLYEGKFTAAVQTKKFTKDDLVRRVLVKEFALVNNDTDLSIAQKYLERHPVVFVQEKHDDKVSNVYIIRGKDLLKYYK